MDTWEGFKASDEIVHKAHSEYEKYEPCGMGEKAGKDLGKSSSSLYSTGISQVVKIKDIQRLQQDIENDSLSVIKWLT